MWPISGKSNSLYSKNNNNFSPFKQTMLAISDRLQEYSPTPSLVQFFSDPSSPLQRRLSSSIGPSPPLCMELGTAFGTAESGGGGGGGGEEH